MGGQTGPDGVLDRGQMGCPTGGQTGWPDGVAKRGWPDVGPDEAGWGARPVAKRGWPEGGPDGAGRGAQMGFPNEDSQTRDQTGPDQGCHNGRFWMKMPVRTSFSSGHPPASAVIRGRGSASARARDRASARTRVDTRRAAMGGGNLGFPL
jgi:hypothetical protein